MVGVASIRTGHEALAEVEDVGGVEAVEAGVKGGAVAAGREAGEALKDCLVEVEGMAALADAGVIAEVEVSVAGSAVVGSHCALEAAGRAGRADGEVGSERVGVVAAGT